MDNIRLVLGGEDVTKKVNLRDFTLTAGLTNEGNYGIFVSTQLETSNADFINNKFSGTAGKDAILKGQIQYKPFDYTQDINVLPKGVTLCDDCLSKFSISSEENDASKCYKILSKLTMTDPEFINLIETSNKVRYLLYNLDLNGLLINAAATLAGITVIPGIVATILGKTEELQCLLAGACRGHAVHKVNDMLEWAAGTCGLSIDSTIIYDDRFIDAYVLPQAIQNGELTFRPAPTTYDAKNYTETTITEFLDEYVKLFNGEWRIQGNKLVIEHWTFFKNQAIFVGTVEDACVDIVEQCAALSIKYTDDSDLAGNSSAPEYDERKNFLNPGDINRTKVCDVLIQLGRTQGTKSRQQDKSKLVFFDNPSNGVKANIFNAEITGGITRLPKVFITQLEREGLVIPSFREIPDSDRYQFNYQLSFLEDDPDSLLNIYYDDMFPGSGLQECYNVPDYTLPLCQEYFDIIVNAFSQSKTVYLDTAHGEAYFNRANINLGLTTQTIVLTGGKIYG